MTREQPRNPTQATQAMREKMKSDGVSPARYVAEQLLRGEKVPDISEWVDLAACGSKVHFTLTSMFPALMQTNQSILGRLILLGGCNLQSRCVVCAQRSRSA